MVLPSVEHRAVANRGTVRYTETERILVLRREVSHVRPYPDSC